MFEYRKVSVEIFQEELGSIVEDILMMKLGAHLLLEGRSAFLVANGMAAMFIDVLKELKYHGDAHMLTHSSHEILHSDHMEGCETFVIFLLLLLNHFGTFFK